MGGGGGRYMMGKTKIAHPLLHRRLADRKVLILKLIYGSFVTHFSWKAQIFMEGRVHDALWLTAELSWMADVGRIGVGICYDIRFQELAMVYAARGLTHSTRLP